MLRLLYGSLSETKIYQGVIKMRHWMAHLLLSSVMTVSFAEKSPQQMIAKRIEPVGAVKLVDSNVDPKKSVTQANPKKNKGQDIYESKCGLCHDANPTIPVGAPEAWNATAWSPRLKKGEKALLKSMIEGVGAMPPRGTCADCSDDDLLLAMKFMLPKVPEKKSEQPSQK